MTTLAPPPAYRGAFGLARTRLARRPDLWTYHLTPAEIGEIETAVAGVRERGLDIGEINRPISRCRPWGRCSTGCAKRC